MRGCDIGPLNLIMSKKKKITSSDDTYSKMFVFSLFSLSSSTFRSFISRKGFHSNSDQQFNNLLAKDILLSKNEPSNLPMFTDTYYDYYYNENITYEDKYTSTDFLSNQSTITLINTVFDTCGISDIGCIVIENSSITINNCTFMSCYGFQGIMNVYTSNLSAFNTNFTFNYADDDGGAIYASFSTLSFRKCLFIKNQSPTEGGALYCNSCDVSLYNSLFYANQAGHQSSACEFHYCHLDCIRTSFIHNIIADIGDLEDDEIGLEDTCGVITLNECPLANFQRSRFVENKAGPTSDKILRIEGETTVKIGIIFIDAQNFNDSIEIIEDGGETPIISVEKPTYSTLIPRRYQAIIADTEGYVKHVIVKCASNMTTSYLIATILVSTTLILCVIGGLAKISGLF